MGTLNNIINENIKTAKRTANSLMAAGFHGDNGLDPSTCFHILKTYVSPTLPYELDILISTKLNIDKLERFLKNCSNKYCIYRKMFLRLYHTLSAE